MRMNCFFFFFFVICCGEKTGTATKMIFFGDNRKSSNNKLKCVSMPRKARVDLVTSNKKRGVEISSCCVSSKHEVKLEIGFAFRIRFCQFVFFGCSKSHFAFSLLLSKAMLQERVINKGSRNYSFK